MDIIEVTLTGNLTRDPELKTLPSGTKVCNLRIASNSRTKDAAGEWVDKANFFNVTVWGGQGEQCANYLSKGRGVAVAGELDWREWEDKQTGNKRQAIDIVARKVKFLGSGEGRSSDNANGAQASTASDLPADTRDLSGDPQPATVGGGGDDDLPF